MDEATIQQKRRDDEERATASRASILGFPYLDSRSFEQTVALVPNVLEKQEMRRNFIVPLHAGDEERPFEFMITSQTPHSFITNLRQNYIEQGRHAVFYLISLSGFKALMLRYDPPREERYDDIKISGDGDSETIAAVSETLNSVSTEKVFNFLLTQADKLGASDIHIENLRDTIRVRMRVDGLLHPVANISRDRYRVIMGELSSRANVSTASNKPQSGHMQMDILKDGENFTLNIRVETIPTMFGQDAVLRLFNFDENLLNLDALGLSTEERKLVDEVVAHPHGLVLAVGPTGSGKSTTLYSVLNALNSTERKIITLEDPVEYSIGGITQIPIDTSAGETFDENFRSVLRLDPDVVMVGEIRDAATARTALQASITGHLVLSSVHASNSAAAFSRIIDLVGVNPVFATSVRLIMAQRLVRKLSPEKEAYTPDEATLKYLHEQLDGVDGVNWDDLKLYKPVATEENPFGYAGRTIIMEQLVVTEEIQAFLRGEATEINPSAIEKAAKKAGMLTLEQKGLLLAIRGETSLEEVTRVL